MADGFGRKRSQLWMHFSIVSGERDKAKCDICKALFSYKGGTTSNLKKHLNSKHQSVSIEMNTPTTPHKQTNKRKKRSTDIKEIYVSPTSEIEVTTISDIVADSSNSTVTKITSDRSSSQNSTPTTSNRSQKETTTTISESSETSLSAASSIARPQFAVRQKLLNNLVIKMIAKDLQPFSIVDDLGFRELITALNPSYHLPSRSTLTRQLLPKIYESAVQEIKIHVSNAEFITLTIDEWISSTSDCYIAATAHYISESWEMRSCLLECFKYDDNNTADNLRKELMKIVDDWGITNRLYAIVTDNSANISAAVQLAGWTHLPCFAHSINLIVQSGIHTIQLIHNKVKTIVKHFEESDVAADSLRLIQIQLQKDTMPLKLKNDVVTRWNSTYYMFQRICDIREAVEAALGWLHNPVETLTAEEWVILRELCAIFKPFDQITVELSKEKDITLSNVIVMARGLINALNRLRSVLKREISLTFLEEMLASLTDRFHQIQYHPVFSRATFLDPRFKQFGFSDDEAVVKVKEFVKSDLSKVVDSTERKRATSGESDALIGADGAGSPELGEDSIWEELDKQHRSSKKVLPMSAAITELQQYSEEAKLDRKENPLEWWKTRAHVYPKLSTLAKKNLSVVATSVPSERMFSKAGQIISERRSRIKPSKMHQLIFLNANQNVI